MTYFLRPDFQANLPVDDDPFAAIMSLRGELIRAKEGRRTLCFVLKGKRYFLKAHYGVGWREIFKNLLQLRWPVVSARNEWLAIQNLERLGVATTPLIGYGLQGFNPAGLKSFVITAALENTVTLEVFCKPWEEEPPRTKAAVYYKRALLEKLAEIARVLHDNGMNHRDFYLCHFRLDLSQGGPGVAMRKTLKIYLMDLHRVQIRRRIPTRWIIKDLGSLYFSAMDIGLTRRDLLRFMQVYRQRPLRAVLTAEPLFWRRVGERAVRLYRNTWDRLPKSLPPS
jgi:heptose I phosphotransferase